MSESASLTRKVALRWLGVWPVGIVGALAAWHVAPPFVRHTRSEESVVFELFAAFVVLTGAAILFLHRHALQLRPVERLPTILLFLVITLHATGLAEYRARSGDYEVYEAAARAVHGGENPYAATGGQYRYPPLLAQVLATGSDLGRRLGLPEPRSWTAVFFVYEAAQLVLVGTSFVLLHLLGLRLGLTVPAASALVTALLSVGAPVIRSLHYNQPNLWLLNLVMVALFTLDRRPALSGSAIALATHLKVYPVIVLGPWLAAGRLRVCLWAGICAVAILLLQIAVAPGTWWAFIEFAEGFPPGTAFRDGGFYSFGFNLAGMFSGRISSDARTTAAAATWLTAVVAGLLWLAHRVIRRRHLEVNRPFFRQAGDTSDALVIALLISPMVWEHHFVLALPLAVFAAAVAPRGDHVKVASALTLAFLLPVFDLFPLSHLRTLGIIWLLLLTNPVSVAGRGSDVQQKKPAAC